MAEESEGLDTGAAAAPAGVDPAALGLALAGASREKANQFLEEQIALTRLQAKELAHELKLRHWSLQLHHASAILKFMLEVSLALIGIAVACFIGAVVWNAAHADGLVIESFSVPPDLAAQGLTGQAIAGQLMDKLSEMQRNTGSNRAPKSYANDWDNNIKVEIPETGVSVGEVYSFLKSWLGHETHLSGDVWRTQNGLAITARTSDGGSNTVSGAEPDLDSLIQKAAEGIYDRTQPFRYAQYVRDRDGRVQEAIARFQIMARTGTPNDRGWAYNAWSNSSTDSDSVAERERLFKLALPYGVPPAFSSLANLEDNLGRPELALSYYDKADGALRSGSSEYDPRRIPAASKSDEAREAALRGDFQTATQDGEAAMEGGNGGVNTGFSYLLVGWQASEHDVAGAQKTLANAPPGPSYEPGANLLAPLNADMQIAQEVGDWMTVLADGEAMIPIVQKYPGDASIKPTAYDPQIAIAEAKLGKFADAERLISPTPADCYPCLMARADIAEMQGRHAQADEWFGRAVKADPSIPVAESDWGQSYLMRGKPDDAIAKFKLANQKGPHFADPLEGWGEAWMAKNRSDLAIAKFEEAEKYAPNWGRLHLKWGEALYHAGKKDDAAKQLAQAAGLDLTPSEKADLAGMNHG